MLLPWIAHFYTALGAATALLAAQATSEGDYRAAFIWLGVQIFIDATDGFLARAVKVKERLPWFDGGLLDNIIDYITYVFVPMLIALRAGLINDTVGMWVACFVLIASGYGFSRADAKVEVGQQHFFTGFPSYWSIVVLYLYVFELPQQVNTAILVVLAILVFVPIRYVYPSRTTVLQTPTMILGFTWAAIVMYMTWRLPDTTGPWRGLSLIFPIYYTLLSFWLHWKTRS